jgi:hypothetical protein
MKSDHRHELKTNELADWVAHFPEWASENRNGIVIGAAVILVASFVYFWSFYHRDAVAARNQARLTSLVEQLSQQMNNVARAAMQNNNQALALLPIAKDLQDFAQKSSNGDMAALALTQRGAALRAELHYQLTEASRDEQVTQIGKAQASYQEALDRKPSSPALAGAAHYGLGLCEEELGNFDKAGAIYREIAKKPEYAGTTAQAAAAYRLQIMNDYRTEVVFQPAPPKPPLPAFSPIQIKPGDAKAPTIQLKPGDPKASAPMVQIKPVDATAPATAPAPKDATVAPATPDGAAKTDAAPAPAPQVPSAAPASPPAGAGSPDKSDTNTPKGN